MLISAPVLLYYTSMSTASAAEVDFECVVPEGFLWEEGAVGIVGVPPLDIACEVLPPEGSTYSAVSWTVGDGTLHFGESITHRYDSTGQFTVSVLLEDFSPADGAIDEPNPEYTRYGFVTVCAPPEPQFTFVNKGDLDFKLVNQSTIAPGCLDTSRWELYRGDSAQGVPAYEFDTWEPRFSLEEEGTWTIRLSQTGIAGTTYADVTFDARQKLTDDLTDGPRAVACSTISAPSGLLSSGPSAWLFASLLACVRRR